MNKLKESEFVRSLPVSIAYLINEFMLYIGLFTALVGAIYFGSWWAFPVIFLLVMMLSWGIQKALVKNKVDTDKPKGD